ncbi:MAG: NAD(P)-dependent oxidoreductase [Blastopirellula sp.]|nr:MAG: NAD(P)-dependent oxidoreductase [Blastopirellula sp.]
MSRLEGKTCLVTAAGQGIGRASALAMHREGAHVFATDINEEALTNLKSEGLDIFVLDVCSPPSIEEAVNKVGPLDVLFNCAGIVDHGSILDCDEDAWAFSLDLNVTAMYRMMRAFIPGILENSGGSIINMSSVASSIIAAPNRFSYGATKAAVIGMTKAVAADFVQQGIRCNAICPGTVESPSLHDRMRAQGDYDTARAAFVARQPMGRIGTPEEIASLVVYLASDDSSFTTGMAHVIDGGWSNT